MRKVFFLHLYYLYSINTIEQAVGGDAGYSIILP